MAGRNVMSAQNAASSIPMVSLGSAPHASQHTPQGGASSTASHHSQAQHAITDASTNPSNSTVGTTSTPQQPSSPHPPSTYNTTPSPLSSSSPPTNSSPTTPSQPQLPHPSSPITRPPHKSRKFSSALKYWLKPLLALTIYTLTLGIAFSASAQHTLLGRVSPILGTWFLAVLAKVGDLFYAYAVADAFDSLAWAKTTRATHVPAPGVPLNWFLAVTSSTGVFGLVRILWRGVWRRGTRAVGGVKEAWRGRTRTTRWGVARLVCVVVLVPGPGIVLLADIDQTTVFFDVRSITVAAGVAAYEPRIAPAVSTVWGPEIAKLVQSFLRDPSLVWEVKPVSAACKASKSCKSYLLAGGHRTVTPWPFTVEKDGVDAFKLENVPVVQVDLWNPAPEPRVIFPNAPYCTLYGGFDPKNEYSMQVCLKDQDTDNTLIAGWVACQEGYSPIDLSCLAPATQSGLQSSERPWSTYLSFHRRTATVVFSRDLFTIQMVSDLSRPASQNITAASLFQAINAVLYRPNQTTNDFRYDRKSQQYVLTSIIATGLWANLYQNFNSSSFSTDWMKNLLTMPVFLFQPTAFGLSNETSVPTTYTGTTPLEGLSQENYVKGSYCKSSKRAIPGGETVVAYACVAAFVVLCVFIAKGRAWNRVSNDTTEYPLLNYDVLLGFMDEMGQPVRLKDRFQGGKYDDARVLDEVAGLKVKYVDV